jgi:hypothetical protein
VPECLQKAIFYLELKRDKYVYYTGGFLAWKLIILNISW